MSVVIQDSSGAYVFTISLRFKPIASFKPQASSSVDQKEFPYPIEQVVKSSFYATAHSTAMVDVNMLHEFVQLRTSMSRKNKGGYASS